MLTSPEKITCVPTHKSSWASKNSHALNSLTESSSLNRRAQGPQPRKLTQVCQELCRTHQRGLGECF